MWNPTKRSRAPRRTRPASSSGRSAPSAGPSWRRWPTPRSASPGPSSASRRWTCTWTVEAGAMEERMARALGMEPGRACTEDGTALTHTVEGMQASVVAGCADLFDDDASAISGPRCRGSSADGGELGVSERTRRSDLGPDVPCVLAAVGEASTTACTARATTCRWTGRPRPCAQGRGRRRGERGGGGGGWGHGAGRGPLPPRSCAAWTCRAAASFCPRRTWATGCTSRTRGRTRRQRRAGAMAFRQR